LSGIESDLETLARRLGLTGAGRDVQDRHRCDQY
jgi:hypothetical protein